MERKKVGYLAIYIQKDSMFQLKVAPLLKTSVHPLCFLFALILYVLDNNLSVMLGRIFLG